HLALLPAEPRAKLETAARARRSLKLRWLQGPTAVYALRPGRHARAPRADEQPLARAGWSATASAAPSLAPLALDDDPRTAWRNWGDLDAGVQRAWYDPRPILDRWKVFLQSGPVTFPLDLGATRSVSSIRMRLGGSDPMVLPALKVETSADGNAWTPLAV